MFIEILLVILNTRIELEYQLVNNKRLRHKKNFSITMDFEAGIPLLSAYVFCLGKVLTNIWV